MRLPAPGSRSFDRYLRLLGVARRRLSREALRELTLAHLTRVPFENVSKLCLRRQPELPGLAGLERFFWAASSTTGWAGVRDSARHRAPGL